MKKLNCLKVVVAIIFCINIVAPYVLAVEPGPYDEDTPREALQPAPEPDPIVLPDDAVSRALKRTRELELKNQVLKLTRTVFEVFPIPIVGISSDQSIILMNDQAKKVIVDSKTFTVGNYISELLPQDWLDCFMPVLELKKESILTTQKLNGLDYIINFFSLPGHFKGKTFILCFQQQGTL